MCLALIAHQAHPAYPLIVAANRDEFHERPTATVHWWPNGILAGQDLSAGGTWFGVLRSGRIALLTNYRDGRGPDRRARSRGELVVSALATPAAPEPTLTGLMLEGAAYAGFSLIAGYPGGLYCVSNRGGELQRLGAGIFGLSNHLLDAPWPKVRRSKARLAAAVATPTLDPEALFSLLDDRTPAPDAELPETGVGVERERFLSSPFIVGDSYGTRSSSVLLIGADGRARLVERTFRPNGCRAAETDVAFELSP
jgi:uncharacterized protein with NRDE domain